MARNLQKYQGKSNISTSLSQIQVWVNQNKGRKYSPLQHVTILIFEVQEMMRLLTFPNCSQKALSMNRVEQEC